jgi:hypothetical protein
MERGSPQERNRSKGRERQPALRSVEALVALVNVFRAIQDGRERSEPLEHPHVAFDRVAEEGELGAIG